MIKKNDVNYSIKKKIVDTSGQQKNFSLEENNIFGFWIYLMSDCIIFAVLFVVFVFMSNYHNNLYILHKKNFSLLTLLIESVLLLMSSITCSMAVYSMKNFSIKNIVLFLVGTFCFGFIFIMLEFYECINLINVEYIPKYHGYFSSFFALIGVHISHVFIGLLWIFIILYQIFNFKNILYIQNMLFCFSFFWHFLDIIWIILVTCIYL